MLESFTTLSYLAACTKHIRLGTGILVLPQRNPLLVAKQAATIQHLSGGRLTLCVGVGYIEITSPLTGPRKASGRQGPSRRVAERSNCARAAGRSMLLQRRRVVRPARGARAV